MHMQTDSTEVVPGDLSGSWSVIAAFASAVDASLDKWLAEQYRIGLTDYRALTLVIRAPDKELRVNDLAHRVGLNQSSATRLVSRLEGKGFARRDLCEKDGRGVYAVITEQGESLVREVRGPYEDRVRELIEQASSGLPQLDAKGLARALGDVAALIAP